MSPSGPRVFGDERGYFYESFNAKAFHDATGVAQDFVQDNTIHCEIIEEAHVE